MHQPVTNEMLQASLQGAVREIISHFSESQGKQNNQLSRIEERVTTIEGRVTGIEGRATGIEGRVESLGHDVAKIKLAVVDLMSTDRHLHNLVSVLRREGIKVNDAEVFA